MYLHEDRETFRDLILQVADKNGRTPMVVEKDYYVTLILRWQKSLSSVCSREERHYQRDFM